MPEYTAVDREQWRAEIAAAKKAFTKEEFADWLYRRANSVGPVTRPERGEADDPAELLAVGTRMNERLIMAVTAGLSHGEDEEQMILTTYQGLCNQPLRQTAAHALAGIFTQARDRKWDLVIAYRDGTRVVIHCDTQEEQIARALEMAKEQP